MYARGIALAILIIASAWPQCATFAQVDEATDAYQVAAEHYHRQRWRMAADEFAAFIKRHPNHRLTRSAEFFAGEAALQAGVMKTAHGHYLRYLQLGGSQYESIARFRAGETAYLLQMPEVATEHLGRFVKDHPTDKMCGYAQTYLGNLALDSSDAATAVPHFSAALRKFADESFADECRYGLAKAYQSLGKTNDAERFFTFLANSPKYRESAHLQLAVMQMERDLDAAKATLENLQRDVSDDQVAAQATYWLGVIAYRKGDWQDSAEMLLDLELVDDRLSASAAFTCADALHHLGDAAGEEAQLRRIVSDWPDSSWGDDALLSLIKLAQQQKQFGQLEGYAAEFRKLYSSSEFAPTVARIEGRSLLSQGKYEAAIRAFEQTPRRLRSPSDWYHLALARLATHDDDQALVALDQVRADESTPLYTSTLLATATALVRKGQFDQAVPIMQRYLAKNPHGVESNRCRAQLTIALASMGRWDAAREAYETLPATDASEFWSTTRFMAEGAAARQDTDWARQLYLKMAADGPNEEIKSGGLAGAAWLDIEAGGQPANASNDAVEKLLRDFPDSPRTAKVVLRHAQSLRTQGATAEAIAAYQRYLDHYPSQPDVLSARLELAELLDRDGQDDEARRQLETVLAADGPAADQARYLLGWVYHDLDEGDKSLEQFQWIVDNAPQSRLWADAAYRLAEHAAKSNDTEKAENLASQITARNESTPTAAHAWYLRGQLAAKRKRWEEVERHMVQVSAIDAAKDLYVPARYWTAESFYRRKEYDKAEEAFAALRRLTKGRNDAWLGMLALRQAQILAHHKRWRDAYENVKQIREEHPQFAQMHEVDYLMGRCLGSWADFDAARESYRRVVNSPVGARTETAAMAQWMIGETYLLQRKYSDAIREYHRVVRSPRWQAVALLQAAKCHVALREPKQAIRLLDQLLSEHPQSKHAEDAKKRRAALLAAPDSATKR